MPQFKKISFLTNNLLPKMDGVYAHQDFGAYLPIYCDNNKSSSQTSEAESDGADSLPSRPRKRQRLDHLSQEEKIMRRKLKNRVAAQTARDRKKAKMAELEEQVHDLESERKFLLLENSNLHRENEELLKENTELKLRLGEITVKEEVTEESEVSVAQLSEAESRLCDGGGSLEHASFISVPLQQEQDLQLLTLWMMRSIYLPLIVRLMLCLIYLNNVVKVCYTLKTSPLLFQILEKAESVKPQHLKWWGPHQKAWNPTKN